jgi:hypothetical protein
MKIASVCQTRNFHFFGALPPKNCGGEWPGGLGPETPSGVTGTVKNTAGDRAHWQHWQAAQRADSATDSERWP